MITLIPPNTPIAIAQSLEKLDRDCLAFESFKFGMKEFADTPKSAVWTNVNMVKTIRGISIDEFISSEEVDSIDDILNLPKTFVYLKFVKTIIRIINVKPNRFSS